MRQLFLFLLFQKTLWDAQGQIELAIESYKNGRRICKTISSRKN